MCMCGKATINGEHGYSWDGNSVGVYPPNPPALAEGDTLIHDEPGRCGGVDSHSHHFRVVNSHGSRYLLVRHGAGDERIFLGVGGRRPSLIVNQLVDSMDSTDRYWLLQSIYHIQDSARSEARDAERSRWLVAAAQKRIKLRRRDGRVHVEIMPARA